MDNMHYKMSRSLLCDCLQAEHTAAQFYQGLISTLDDTELCEAIGKMRDEEIMHAIMLANLYKYLYRCEPSACRSAEVIPVKAAEGLSLSINDELNAYEEYRNIYLMNCDPKIRAVFFELMSDEIKHSVRCMYILKNI